MNYNIDPEKAIKATTTALDTINNFLQPKGLDAVILDGHRKLIEDFISKDSINAFEKEAFLANYKNIVKEFKNKNNIKDIAISLMKKDLDDSHLSDDWLSFFFDNAKLISDEQVQKLWGAILASEAIGNHAPKSLIQTLSVLEKDDALTFITISNLTLRHKDRERSIYPIVFIVDEPHFYEKMNIRRYKLASLQKFGLIEYNTHNEFPLPKEVPILLYGDTEIHISSPKNDRIPIGNIRITSEGRYLWDFIMKKELLGFKSFLSNYYSKRGFVVDMFDSKSL
jgi:hypothetical protein